MSERADADAVHAGLGDGADRFQRYAAGGFQEHVWSLVVAPEDRFSQPVRNHVVEQDDIWQKTDCPAELIEGIDLNLQGYSAFVHWEQLYGGLLVKGTSGALKRLPSAAQSGEMVVLDQDTIVQAHAVI